MCRGSFVRCSTLLLMLSVAGAALAATPEEVQARKERILGNLLLQYPQLKELGATVSDIKPTDIPGLESGSFVVPGRGEQRFLITSDDKKLWMVGGEPIDVSLSQEEIDKRLAERKVQEEKQNTERKQKLDQAVAGMPIRGNPDARVTIVEFSDFQCPYCSRGADTMEEVLTKYPNDVKFVFKNFPLAFHPWAKPAAIAAHCAALQNHDAFWTLHDKFFRTQSELTQQNVIEKSKEYLQGSKVDLDKWSTCAEKTDTPEYKAASEAVDADMQLGQSLGVSGTPGFFVNGTFLSGAQPLTTFEPLIQQAKSGS